jgi:hypothetical protein
MRSLKVSHRKLPSRQQAPPCSLGKVHSPPVPSKTGKHADVQIRLMVDQRLHAMLLKHYRAIFNVYTFFSSLSPTMSFAISERLFYQFVHEAHIPDEHFSMVMIEKLFILGEPRRGVYVCAYVCMYVCMYV